MCARRGFCMFLENFNCSNYQICFLLVKARVNVLELKQISHQEHLRFLAKTLSTTKLKRQDIVQDEDKNVTLIVCIDNAQQQHYVIIKLIISQVLHVLIVREMIITTKAVFHITFYFRDFSLTKLWYSLFSVDSISIFCCAQKDSSDLQHISINIGFILKLISA